MRFYLITEFNHRIFCSQTIAIFKLRSKYILIYEIKREIPKIDYTKKMLI